MIWKNVAHNNTYLDPIAVLPRYASVSLQNLMLLKKLRHAQLTLTISVEKKINSIMGESVLLVVLKIMNCNYTLILVTK